MTTLHPKVTTTTSWAPSVGSGSQAQNRAIGYALGALRIVIGWTFLWAFLDKLLALGYSTGRDAETGVVDRFGDAAWIHGGSPTEGFLGFAAKGPFEGLYHNLAGTAFADWGFMFGLAAIGIAFTFGITTRLAAIGAAVMYLLMWSVVLAPENNPITDDHTIGLLVVVVLGLFGAGRYLGLGTWWEQQSIVQKFPILK
jgi:thiosulfate dehydrogenase [quinone] large subunit